MRSVVKVSLLCYTNTQMTTATSDWLARLAKYL